MILAYKGQSPKIHPSAKIIGKNITIIGSVQIHENVSVWPGAVLRADIAEIIVGKNSNIQDGAVLHVNYDLPVIIGEEVTVGHNAVLHGCTIGNNCVIGMGSILLDGCKISKNCVVGAGTVVTEKTTVPEGHLILGVPGKIKRKLTSEEIELIKRSAKEYIEFAKNYPEEER
ncbi:MAG: gamma carbonic anhydrase family protein [Elusimicrobia bacterium]|nr:gamma carbonic anhydrase family protein [Elusimicrobiota bacterium]